MRVCRHERGDGAVMLFAEEVVCLSVCVFAAERACVFVRKRRAREDEWKLGDVKEAGTQR